MHSPAIQPRWPTSGWVLHEAKIYAAVAIVCGACALLAGAVSFAIEFSDRGAVAAVAVAFVFGSFVGFESGTLRRYVRGHRFRKFHAREPLTHRCVDADAIYGFSIGTSGQNTLTPTARVTLPPADTVDAKAELAALREAMAKLKVPDRNRLDRAFKDAKEEAAKPSPDRDYVSEAVQRMLKVAMDANDFADQLQTLKPRLTAMAGWIGPAGRALLSLVGLSA